MKNIPNVLDKRRAGILLHITSLPSTLGNGTMGKHAYRFIDFLTECGLSVWQILPIHPPQRVPLNTPYRDFLSPYQPQSVQAGNPLLINLEKLIKKGWLPKMTLPSYHDEQLEQSFDYRYRCLKSAYSYFSEHAKKADQEAYQQFVEENQEWLDDYALFCALKDFHKGACWWNWQDKGYRNREPQALNKACKHFAQEIEQYRFIQFAFFSQWQELQEYAHQNGVYLFGDMPFFVARDSVEVWAYPNKFLLDKNKKPKYLSGISPNDDYFHFGKGQCWGHPLYDWENLQKDNFQWWINRFKKANELFDFVRLTYFRGFYQCWAIPADSLPASGKWQLAPWRILFNRVKKEEIVKKNFNKWIAEDVVGASRRTIKLRNYEFSGIKILQLAFNDNSKFLLKNQHLPHHHKLKDVVYTGTHDSNTTLGWFEWITKDKNKQEYVCGYLDAKEDFPWALIQAALRSVAKLAIIPMQDILGLDAEHRMTTPRTSNKRNWRWQFEWSQITIEIEEKLKKLVERLVERYERN